jgi:excisionase family DNA binding protein
MSGHPPERPLISSTVFEQLIDSRKASEGCLSTPTQYFEPLISEVDAAKMLGLHPKTVQRLARRGDLPSVRIGRYWRFRASRLNEWIDVHSTCQPVNVGSQRTK